MVTTARAEFSSPHLRGLFTPGVRRESKLLVIGRAVDMVQQGKFSADEARDALRGCLREDPARGIDAEMAQKAKIELRRLIEAQRPKIEEVTEINLDTVLNDLTDMRVKLLGVSAAVKTVYDLVVSGESARPVLARVGEHWGRLEQFAATIDYGLIDRQAELGIVSREEVEQKIQGQPQEILARLAYITKVAGSIANTAKNLKESKLEGSIGAENPSVETIFTAKVLEGLGLFEAQAKLFSAAGEGEGLAGLAKRALDLELMAHSLGVKKTNRVTVLEGMADEKGIPETVARMRQEIGMLEEKVQNIKEILLQIQVSAKGIEDATGQVILNFESRRMPAAPPAPKAAAPAKAPSPVPPPPVPPPPGTPIVPPPHPVPPPPGTPIIPPPPPVAPPPTAAPAAKPAARTAAPPPPPRKPAPGAGTTPRPASPPAPYPPGVPMGPMPMPPRAAAAPGAAPLPVRETLKGASTSAAPAAPAVPTLDVSKGVVDNIIVLHRALNPENKGRDADLERIAFLYLGTDVHTDQLQQLALEPTNAGKMAEQICSWLAGPAK